MGRPVVHFEIVGREPERLRAYYGDLFGWEFDTPSPVAQEVSEKGKYGFVDGNTTPDGVGIPGGIGGGASHTPHVLFYVAVPDVEEALRKAEVRGGKRIMGPASRPDGGLVVGHFADPEGNVVGVAGPR
jgi:predicted enzyme related to lactoylglutathione lyase